MLTSSNQNLSGVLYSSIIVLAKSDYIHQDAVGQVIRKASERLPYPVRGKRGGVAVEYREVLGSNCL